MTNNLSKLFACLLFAAGASADGSPEIRVGSELDFRPYCFTDTAGRPTGFGVELIQAVADKMGLRLRIVPGPWERVWSDLVDGNLDVLPIVARTPGREPLVDFGLPHTETFDAFFVRRDRPAIPSLTAATGKRIVVLREDAAHHQLVERGFGDALVPVESIADGLRLVAAGTHDAFLCSKLIATLEMRQHGVRGVAAGPPIPDYKRVFSFAVRKGNTELLEKLNQGLLIVKTDGEYEDIYLRWLAVEEPWRRWLPYFRWVVGAIVALAAAVLTLQWLVRRRTRELVRAKAGLLALNATLEAQVAERTAALRDSEQRMQQALSASRSFTFDWDPKTDIVLRSDSFGAIFGIAGDEAVHDTGQGYFQRIHAGDRDRFVQMLRSLTPAAANYATEYRVMRADGSEVVLEEIGQGAFDTAGGLARLFGVSTDITERKEAEERLQQANAGLLAANTQLATSRASALNLMEDADFARQQAEQANAELRESRQAAMNLMNDAVAARERADWLARVPDESPSPIVRVATDGTVLYRNPAAAERPGWMCEAGQQASAVLRALVDRAVTQRQGAVHDVEMEGSVYSVTVALFPEERYANLYGRDVTEERRAQRHEQEALTLAAASQSAVDILESMGEGVLLLDMEGRILSVNPAMARMSGIPVGEAVGRPVRDLLPELLSYDEQSLAAAALAAAMEGRIPNLPPITLLKRGGDRIPIIPSITFVRGLGGKPSAIVATLRDLTELRSLESSLEESHALLERVFDNTHVAMVYLDRDFNFVLVNRAYADGCGSAPDFFPGKNHFALYPHAENEAIFRRVVETGEPFAAYEKPFEFHEHPERGVTYWDWTLRPLKGARGRVESLLFCLLDVTTRVRARQELAESERKYRELVENANSIIMRVTPEHDITFFNEYAQTFFGYSEAEVLGRNILGTITPEVDSEGRDLRALLRDISARPELHGSNENENMRSDGRRVWVHWANKAVRDQNGNVTEILCVGTDITERKRMQAQAARYQRRLRGLAERLAASEEQDRWRISRYIHDTIVQNLSLSHIYLGSLSQPLADAELAEETQKIHAIRGLLDEAMDKCRMVMSDLTPALLYELGLIPALNGFARQQAEKHGARVIIESAEQELPLPPALRGLLFESVRELIMNAIKHAGPCEIRVASRCLDSMLEIRVTDNGKGFDPSSEEPAGDNHGGFGTFNIRLRIEGLGGDLEIASEPGKGTTATIRLPMGD